MAKKLRCYIGLHRLEGRKSNDGTSYDECRDCGKFVIVDEQGRFAGGPS